MKERSIILCDSGDKRFSTTTISTAAAAVVAVLKMGDRSKNRAFKVQDIVTTQNQLLKLGKEVTPGSEWTVKPVSTAEIVKKPKEALAADPNSRLAAVLRKEYNSDFGGADNAELGIRMMDETQLKEMLKKLA